MDSQVALSSSANKRKISGVDSELAADSRRRKFADYDDCRWLECCDKCQAMTGTFDGLHALIGEEGYEHYNWQEIQDSVARGCALCGHICEITEGAWDEDDDGLNRGKKIRVYAAESDAISPGGKRQSDHPLEGMYLESLLVQIPYVRAGPPPYQTLKLLAFEEDPVSSFVPGRRAFKDLSRKVVDRACEWLNECQDQHQDCPKRCIPLLPKRVISIRDDEKSLINLHISKDEERGQYAALSYCWGGGQQITTTLANLSTHIQGLPVHLLPKTLSDAIKVAQKIGMRFLWIDALCIIQDDAKDKLAQIAKMGTIYKNATFTIVAASAESVSECFLSNAKVDSPTAKLPFYLNERSSGVVYVGMEGGEPNIHENDPLFSRGWTLQEMLLSPRMLVFDAYQLTLTCREDHFEPVVPTHVTFEPLCRSLPISIFGVPDFQMTVRKSKESIAYYFEVQQFQIWADLINEYSGRDLSVFEDRLPALAGIACELRKYWDDTYVAGFWKVSLINHLGWCKHGSGGPFEERKIFVGMDVSKRIGSPSWSWSTVPYRVHVWKIESPDARVIDCQVEPVSPDVPFGHVKRGILTLDALILNASDFQQFSSLCQPDNISGSREITLDFSEPELELENTRLVFLGYWLHKSKGIFLVLRKLKDEIYERIGQASLDNSQGGIANILTFAARELIVIE